jgi:hypothetical protein
MDIYSAVGKLPGRCLGKFQSQETRIAGHQYTPVSHPFFLQAGGDGCHYYRGAVEGELIGNYAAPA